MGRDTRHVSEDEKKKGLIIVILVGILIAIALMIVILMIPKGNEDNKQPVELSSKVVAPTGNQTTRDVNNPNKPSRHSNSISSPSDLDIIAKDKTKVSLEIKPGSLTVDGAVIVITDNNVSHYIWTPIYKIQEKVNGQWQDLELKNPENAIFPEINYNNTTGVMEQSLIWSNKYGQLEKGTYRIVKEASGLEFYAEFEVQ